MPKKKKGGKKESDGPAVAADEVDFEIAHEVPQAATASAASDSMAPSAKSAALAALTAPDSAPMDRQKAAELWNAMQELAMSRQKPPKKDHQFWNTQPVPQMGTPPHVLRCLLFAASLPPWHLCSFHFLFVSLLDCWPLDCWQTKCPRAPGKRRPGRS